MTAPLLALVIRDLRLHLRQAGSATAFVMAALLALALARDPSADPPDAGLVWLIILLALLPSIDRLFAEDLANGTCALIATLPAPLALFAFAKCLAQWIAAQPLLLLASLFALSLRIPFAQCAALYICLLPGSLAAIMLAGLPAALTASLPRAGALTALLALPFLIPLLIFGSAASRLPWDALPASTPFLMLLALLALALILAPLAIAAALKNALA